MKNSFNIILIASILLLIFPFIALPELFENIYVSVLAFVIGYFSILIRKKLSMENNNDHINKTLSNKDVLYKDNDNTNEVVENHSNRKISDITMDEYND